MENPDDKKNKEIQQIREAELQDNTRFLFETDGKTIDLKNSSNPAVRLKTKIKVKQLPILDFQVGDSAE